MRAQVKRPGDVSGDGCLSHRATEACLQLPREVGVLPGERGHPRGPAITEIVRHEAVIRLLATDLDGTFWGRDFVPPPEHVAAVDELAWKGVTVLAATSRRPRPTKARLADHGLALNH